jgi:TIR domain
VTTGTSRADLFISHASEDKDFARPLAEALRQHGVIVWYDDYVLRLGDSLREIIDRGLATARFGVVILSPRFFAKEWPRRELNGLLARESRNGVKVVLPIWHDLTFGKVLEYSPTLADRYAVSTSRGLAFVVENILLALSEHRRDAGKGTPRGLYRSSRRRQQDTISMPALARPRSPATKAKGSSIKQPGEVTASGSSAEEQPASYRTTAVAIRERFEKKDTIVVTQARTIEPLAPSFRTHEFLFWQDAGGKLDFVRSDVLSMPDGRPLRHSVEALEHDEYRLRLQVSLRSTDVDGPVKFIVQLRQVKGYPNLFTAGSDYWQLQVRDEIPSLQYTLELPNRSPFDRIELYVTDAARTRAVRRKIEGGDIVFRFGPKRLAAGAELKFNLINGALVRPPD